MPVQNNPDKVGETIAIHERKKLAEETGATITMPLDETFWSPLFGMLTDRFGLGWMVTVPETKA